MKSIYSKRIAVIVLLGLVTILFAGFFSVQKESYPTSDVSLEELEAQGSASLTTNSISGAAVQSESQSISLPNTLEQSDSGLYNPQLSVTANYKALGASAANSVYGSFVNSLDRSPEEKVGISRMLGGVAAHNFELRDQWKAGLITTDGYERSMLLVEIELEKILVNSELEKYQNFIDDKQKIDADVRTQKRVEDNMAQLSGLTEENRNQFLDEYIKIVGEQNEFKKIYFDVEDLRQVRQQLEGKFEVDQLYILDSLILASQESVSQ